MTEQNRKIINATPAVASDGTEMKSKMEVRIYETLLSLGIKAKYEEEIFTYWEGIRPTVPFYDLETNHNKPTYRHLRKNMKKFVSMSYKPDFTFDYKGVKIIIEVKGWENDQFAIRKKLFRAYLETLKEPVVYAEIFTKRQLLEFMEELTKVLPEIKRNNMFDIRRKTADAHAVKYDGTNYKEVIEMLDCKDSVEAMIGLPIDEICEKVEKGELTPVVKHYSCGELILKKGDVIVREKKLVFKFQSEEDFLKIYERA